LIQEEEVWIKLTDFIQLRGRKVVQTKKTTKREREREREREI
jgi:hypothetical protein